MSLLFDSNLSSALCRRLEDLFGRLVHVRHHQLQAEDDRVIWEFAKTAQLAIVSKDTDFQHRSLLFGHPPKVILIRLGNCSTPLVESLLRMNAEVIREFLSDPDSSLLVLPARP